MTGRVSIVLYEFLSPEGVAAGAVAALALEVAVVAAHMEAEPLQEVPTAAVAVEVETFGQETGLAQSAGQMSSLPRAHVSSAAPPRAAAAEAAVTRAGNASLVEAGTTTAVAGTTTAAAAAAGTTTVAAEPDQRGNSLTCIAFCLRRFVAARSIPRAQS